MSDNTRVGNREPVSVAARNLTVRYSSFRVSRDRNSTNPLQRVGLLPSRTSKTAVDDVSLIAHKGESIGVIGRNGSGKSTLLRALSGLEVHSSGEVYASTQPVLLGVSPALLPDRTGIENIEIGCLAMGMTKEEAREAIPAISDLADLGQAIHDPIKTYSSGMGGRLRFAITASGPRSEILMIDEALNTGDISFKNRSEGVMDQLLERAGTIFLVSHSASSIKRMCTRAIWLHEGSVVMDGNVDSVTTSYKRWSWSLNENRPELAEKRLSAAREKYAAEQPEFYGAKKF